MFHVLISLNGKDRDKKRNRFYKKGRFLFRSLHGNKAFFRCHPQHIPICGFPFVRYNTVEYGIFNGRFYLPHNTARCKRKECHYLFSGNRRLKIPYAVFLLNIMQLGTHKCKIIEYAAHLLLIFRSNVGLAKQHERIDVITGIEKQTTSRLLHLLPKQWDACATRPFSAQTSSSHSSVISYDGIFPVSF